MPSPLAGLAEYWREGWNRFDFLLVLTSVLDLVMMMVDLEYETVRVGFNGQNC